MLGVIMLFAFSLDGAAIDWSALLMVGSIGAPVWLPDTALPPASQPEPTGGAPECPPPTPIFAKPANEVELANALSTLLTFPPSNAT